MNRRAVAVLHGTVVAGTLDLSSAFVFGGMAGRTPLQICRSVASGPFGDGMRRGGLAESLVGVGVHFAIMLVVVCVYVVAFELLASTRARSILKKPLLCGVIYGLAVYGVMYWIVLPLRWPSIFPDTQWWNVTNALFSHIVCIGLPIAYLTRRALSRAAPTH